MAISKYEMTYKQVKCISWICSVLRIEYKGKNTKYDAWKFINKHIGKAKEIQKNC